MSRAKAQSYYISQVNVVGVFSNHFIANLSECDNERIFKIGPLTNVVARFFLWPMMYKTSYGAFISTILRMVIIIGPPMAFIAIILP